MFEPLVILAPLDSGCHFRVECLYPDLKLEHPGRKPGDYLAQRLRQPIRNQLEVEEVPGTVMRQQEFENGAAVIEVQIESAIHELELPRATVEQALQVVEQTGQGGCAHRDVQGRQAKLAGKGATT